jgi:hypothetical protein
MNGCSGHTTACVGQLVRVVIVGPWPGARRSLCAECLSVAIAMGLEILDGTPAPRPAPQPDLAGLALGAMSASRDGAAEPPEAQAAASARADWARPTTHVASSPWRGGVGIPGGSADGADSPLGTVRRPTRIARLNQSAGGVPRRRRRRPRHSIAKGDLAAMATTATLRPAATGWRSGFDHQQHAPADASDRGLRRADPEQRYDRPDFPRCIECIATAGIVVAAPAAAVDVTDWAPGEQVEAFGK